MEAKMGTKHAQDSPPLQMAEVYFSKIKYNKV